MWTRKYVRRRIIRYVYGLLISDSSGHWVVSKNSFGLVSIQIYSMDQGNEARYEGSISSNYYKA